MAEVSSANGSDEGFGDFKFASFPNPTVSFNQIGGTDFADDEWGDFVVHPLSNGPSHIQSSSNPSQTSKPFDPFGFFTNDSSKPSESVVSQVDLEPIRSESEKKLWVKPQGALPLSIFGEEEEEKEADSSEPVHTIDKKQVDSAEREPKVDPVVGIGNIISKLYSQNQQIKAENVSPAVFNGRNFSSNSDSNVFHVDFVDGDDGVHEDDDDGWEFKGAVSEKSKVQVGSELLGLKVEATTKQEMQAEEQEISDGGKYTSGFPDALGGSSNFFAASNGLWQETSGGANHVSGFHNVPDSSSDFFAASNGLWQENFKGTKNSSGLHNSTSFFDSSNGLWQESEKTKNTSGFHNAPGNPSGFFDASNGLLQESKGSGFHISSGNSRDLFDASTRLWQEPDGSKLASGSHNPDSSNHFFDASNQLWLDKTEASKLASGFHNAPDNSGDLFAASNELWQENSGGAKQASDFINTPNISTNFFATSNGLWQDNAEGTNMSSGFHNVSNSSTDPFAVSNGLSYEPSKLDIGFDLKPTTLAQTDSVADLNSRGKQIESENVLEPCLDDEDVDPDENFGDFMDSFSETTLKCKEDHKVAGTFHRTIDSGIQENEGRPANLKGALPLTMFSDGALETDDSLNHPDFWALKASFNSSNGIVREASNIPINDLISSLYNQSGLNTSVDSAHKPSENGLSVTETGLDLDAVNGNDDFDNDSWEFKGAFSGAKAEDLTSGHSVDNVLQNFSTKLELRDYVDFYLKLKEKSCFVALSHLDNLKKAKTSAALSGEDVTVEALDKEIKEALKELSQENMLLKEVYPENGAPSNCLDEFLENLRGPKFQVVETEFHLSRRLSLAEKDLRSAVELFKHATSILKILMLGSVEEQSNYVSTWSRMISICAQELKHGAFIWKQSLQKNVYSQILLEPRGQKFILALGEIYRVVKVLGASARLFKPWVLLSSEKVNIIDLLEECATIWSSLGLEDALHCLCDPFGFEYDGTVHALLASIKYVHDLDALSLQNHVFTQQKPICQLSLLTPEMVPGMKMVVWNGNHYFLTLSNLWANLISSDPPKLPDLQIG